MSIGTAFHERTAPLNRKMVWREWSGYFAAGVYADAHDIEYNAVREAAAVFDVSPLFKYAVRGPDSVRLIDRVIPRDAAKIREDAVVYTSWCDEEGKVLDDGTIARVGEQEFRWTAADPCLRWFELNAHGLDVQIEDVTERLAALALQGPMSRKVLEALTGEDWSDVRYFGRRATSVGSVAMDVTRTGYTGDLGYELWMDAEAAVGVWDALMAAGGPYGIRPAGILALDVTRVEAGLILIEADFTSARHALNDEQRYSPYELGLGRFVNLQKPGDFVGRRALEREVAAGGPARRLVGLEIDWDGIQALFSDAGLPPHVQAEASRDPIPLYAGGRQVGKATSTTWSPTLKKMIALASVAAPQSRTGIDLRVEWTVEGRRSSVGATVVELPFFDPPRRRG
jgi:glycine cleavage system T protein (aminomethyltransferase)